MHLEKNGLNSELSSYTLRESVVLTFTCVKYFQLWLYNFEENAKLVMWSVPQCQYSFRLSISILSCWYVIAIYFKIKHTSTIKPLGKVTFQIVLEIKFR